MQNLLQALGAIFIVHPDGSQVRTNGFSDAFILVRVQG
jgi:hypothetical protein